jgi:ABC-type dipeptide/oligopeptide/nickel transport system permease component
MLRGDFGIAFSEENRSVNDIIREHFPVSATLGLLALLFAGAGGVLWGAFTAIYRNKWPDYIIMFFVILGITVPSFVIAAVSQFVILKLNQFTGM